jgi:hypothetical protein
MATTKKQKLGKEQRFAQALQKGKTISRKQATSQYKLGNPSATVARLEEQGLIIERMYGTDRNGLQVVKYRAF